MSEWTPKTLRQIVGQPVSGSRPKGGVSSETEGVPSLGGENVLADGGMTYANLNRVPRSFFRTMPKGRLQALDVLVNKDGAQTGKVGLYRGEFEEACVNEHLFILRNGDGTVDQQFLYYAVLFPETQAKIQRRITGSAQPGLNTQFVDAVTVAVPSQPEQQRRIAEILGTVDEVIAQTEALIAKQQQVKAGLMHDLFTRGLTPDGQLRPVRADAPGLYYETRLGWLPNGWNLARLKDKALPGRPHLKTGPFGSSLKGEHWVNEGHPVITIGALGEGELVASELLFVSDSTAARLHDYQLSPGDVVFSRVADVGRSAVIEPEHDGWIMSSNLMRISLNPALVTPAYLQAQFSADGRLKAQIRAKVNSGGREVANGQILNQLWFAWPRPEEQVLAVERISAAAVHHRGLSAHLAKLRQLKQGLMQALLTPPS